MIRLDGVVLLLASVAVAACARSSPAGTRAAYVVQLHEAQALVAAGDCNAALSRLKTLASRSSTDAMPYRALGTCYSLARNYQDALAADDKGLTIASDDYELLMQRSGAYFGMGQTHRATADMRAAELNSPDSPTALAAVAKGYQSIDDCSDAERVLARVLNRPEPPVSAYMTRATCYTADQRYMLAKRDLDAALRAARAPADRVETWLLLTELYSSTGDTGRAIAAAAGAQHSSPDDLGVAVNAGSLLANLAASSGDSRAAEAALPYLNRVLRERSTPFRRQALVSKADAFRSIGYFAKAAAFYEKAFAESDDPAFRLQMEKELSAFSR